MRARGEGDAGKGDAEDEEIPPDEFPQTLVVDGDNEEATIPMGVYISGTTMAPLRKVVPIVRGRGIGISGPQPVGAIWWQKAKSSWSRCASTVDGARALVDAPCVGDTASRRFFSCLPCHAAVFRPDANMDTLTLYKKNTVEPLI